MNRARMEGIVVFDYADRYHLAVAEMAGYLKEGRKRSKTAVATRGACNISSSRSISSSPSRAPMSDATDSALSLLSVPV